MLSDGNGGGADQSAGDVQGPVPEAGLIPAATVIPLRQSPTGMEVLLLKRNSRGQFGNMWVFPGGRVDSIDAEGIVECEEVEAGTEIDAACERGGDFDACPKRAGPEADRPGVERPKFRTYRWCASGWDRPDIAAFGRRVGGWWCSFGGEGEIAGLGQVERCGSYEVGLWFLNC